MAVPLAALSAMPARAGAILDPLGSCSASITSGSTASCNITQAGATGGNPNLNWIRLSGSGDGVFDSFSGSAIINFTSDGSASGTLAPGTMIPVSWDFIVNSPSGGVGFNWLVQFNWVVNGNSNFAVFPTDGSSSSSSNTEIKGTGLISIPSGGNLTSWGIDLDITAFGDFSLSVPGIDLNPGVPEPASIVLTGAGGIALLLCRRRKFRG